MYLKLVRTHLNYLVLGTSTAVIFLSNDHSLYAPITSDDCQVWFHLYGLSRPVRSAWKAKKYKIVSDNKQNQALSLFPRQYVND